MQERKEDTTAWRIVVEKRFDGTDKKLDLILQNGKSLVTLDTLSNAFVSHAESCPGRNSPNPGPKNDEGNKWLGLALQGWKGLGVVGSLFVINGMLTIAILRLTGVF